MRNLRLKALIVGKFGTQSALCRVLNFSEDRLSKIIHGRLRPRQEERQAIARLLGVPEGEVFPTESN